VAAARRFLFYEYLYANASKTENGSKAAAT
jgi:hypothetical protein